GSPNDNLITQDLTTQVERALSTLSPKEKKILRLRFGIGEEGEHTLEEVGRRFSVTRERIRQIETKALRKLRHPLRGRALRAFVETGPTRGVPTGPPQKPSSRRGPRRNHRPAPPAATAPQTSMIASARGATPDPPRLGSNTENTASSKYRTGKIAAIRPSQEP